MLPLRTFLLQGVRRFVERAVNLPGIERIALVGSLTTPKPSPKDADVLVTVAATQDLDALAKAARSLKGHAQTRNGGADIFLANALVQSPPRELWPEVVSRVDVPADVEVHLLRPMRNRGGTR